MAASISDLCQKQKITVSQLTEKTLLDESRILAIVMGRWTPSPQERKKIAGVFDLLPDQVSWGHKTPIQHIYGHGPG